MSQLVSAAVITALLDKVDGGNGHGGVLGIRALPEWDGPEIVHDAKPVRVVACASALAVRVALRDRVPQQWLVVLTDRDEDDLGIGITAHFAGRRLRQPDPWDAVCSLFEAKRIDHLLANADRRTELASSFLVATPIDGWPPARGGLLTLDHALGSVASARLRLGSPELAVDLAAILDWSARTEADRLSADLSALAGPALTGQVMAWIAAHCGVLSNAAATLLDAGRGADLIPLGLAARAVGNSPPNSGPRALFRREVGAAVTDTLLAPWADAAEQAARRILDDGDTEVAARVLARADALLETFEATSYAASSPLLPRGMRQRFTALGEALHDCCERGSTRAAAEGAPLADPARMPRVEAAWQQVRDHALAPRAGDRQAARGLAGVRLARWLAQPVERPSGLAGEIARHWNTDAWVDRATADAWTGVQDEQLARGLRSVLAASRLRRDNHDASFAAALAAHTAAGSSAPSGSSYVENLVRATVLPIARTRPVLLAVADGMSCAVATEIADDIKAQLDSWQECLPERGTGRLSAIATFPTLTNVSRTSLFCGELAVGEQRVEREGFSRLCQAANVTGTLFHKLSLDSSEAGFALSHDVAAAIDDVQRISIVACVLNAVDDSLDRSDPGGADWTADAVKHLRPLLDRARRAGRVVVLASDHGHLVERREGQPIAAVDVSSNRSRAYLGEAAGPGEVRMTGRRVLSHNGDAILAVDERIRYGPLKAGYHGGAAPAEALIPICVLAAGDPPDGWKLAPPQAPPWWRGAAAAPVEAVDDQSQPARPSRYDDETAAPTLFSPTLDRPIDRPDLVAAVLTSPVYLGQRRRSARSSITDEQVGGLLRAALAASSQRLDPDSAAAALGIATVQLAGALPQVQRLLNVEQYSVIARDADGSTIVLDVALLREQFGVSQ